MLELKNITKVYEVADQKQKALNKVSIKFRKSEFVSILGPSGSGKTTLLNSYVNYLMGIKFIDDFRYKIIIEETKKNQTHSQTSTVTKYNIRAKDGKLFQIIDTPGFGDTKRN